MSEEREISQQQVQDFLVREFGFFLWLSEALVEDEALHRLLETDDNTGPTLETMLKDGLRLCRLARLIDPDCVPKVKEEEAHLAYKCRQNIKLFIEGCEELGVPPHSVFFVSDLWDEKNLLRVLECLEKLAEVADSNWDFPFKLKGKKQAILQMGKVFKKEEQERAKAILRKCQPQLRASVTYSSPVVRDEETVGALARARPMSIAGWGTREPEGRGSGREFSGFPPSRARRPLGAAFPGLDGTKTNSSRTEKTSQETKASTEEQPERRLTDEERQYLGLVRFQSLFRGHKARKLFRLQMRMAMRRENVAREIYRTEHSYVHNLKLLVHVFLSPLDSSRHWPVRGGQPIEMEKMKILSRQISPILGFNKKLVTEYLEPRMQSWNFHSKLGDIFVQISAYLKLYCDYVNNYGPALQELLETKKKSVSLADFLKAQQEIPREFAIPLNDAHVRSPYFSSPEFKRSLVGRVGDIGDYLIQPIQRIPRYLLLLTELLRYTESTHPDYEELVKALKGIKEVTEFIEAQTNKAQNLNKLASIQSRLVPANQIKLVEPHRKFLRESTVIVKNKKEKNERVLILFNDLLLETKPKISKTKSRDECPLSVKQVLDLNCVSAISHISISEKEHCFLIVNEEKRGQIMLEIYCSSKMERYDWVTAIHGAKRQLTTQLLERAELLSTKTSGKERKSGIMTYSEGKGTRARKETLRRIWESTPTLQSAKTSVPALVTIGRKSGRAMSISEGKDEKNQGKDKKERKEKANGRPEKILSDTAAGSTAANDTKKKGHTRNKSWTLSFKEAGKRNKIDLSPRKDIDGHTPSPRSMGTLESDSDSELGEPDGSGRTGISSRLPLAMLHQALLSPRSFGHGGGTSSMSSFDSTSSSPMSSPRTSLSSGSNPGSAVSSPRTSTALSPPSAASPRSSNVGGTPFPPSVLPSTTNSRSFISPSGHSLGSVPTIQRAASTTGLRAAVNASHSGFAPSPPSGGRRPPPPVPSKSSKPTVLLGQSEGKVLTTGGRHS